jgi:predicted ribosomally synthesized peptide with nif11-like leader
MSIERAKAFYQRVITDKNFRTKLQNYSIENRAAFIQASGFDFTQEEWDSVNTEISEHSDVEKELSATELQTISGGVGPFPHPF